MKQFKRAACVFVNTLFLSSTVFAHALYKGETIPTAGCKWTGFYAGVNAGIVNHTMNITDVQATSFLATIQQVSDPRFTGGLQVGYRRQLDLKSVSGVYGLELSVNFANAGFKKEYGSPFALYQLSSEHELNTVGLLEFIGGIAADNTLLFLAAGLSWVNISGTTTNLDSIAFFNSFSVSKKEFGTALGGGIEYLFCDRFSARLKVDVIRPNTYSTSDNIGDTFQISNCIVQTTVGINYKFA